MTLLRSFVRLTAATLVAGTACSVGLAQTAPQESSMRAPAMTEVEDNFDDVAFAVESAILAQGLVIDHVSHVGEMLERTRADVGSDKVLFTRADVFSFCSARISRQVMEADPVNIQHCPYGIFVYERADQPGRIVVGHRTYDGTMAPVQDLLSGIVSDALGLE